MSDFPELDLKFIRPIFFMLQDICDSLAWKQLFITYISSLRFKHK